MMIPSWATVLWVGAMALGLGIAIGRIQIGMKWVKADNKAEAERLAAHKRIDEGLTKADAIISRIDLALSGRRYSPEQARELIDHIAESINDGADGGKMRRALRDGAQ